MATVILDRFSGGNPESWILRAERYFHFLGFSEEHWLSLASFYLEGDALNWFNWLFRNKQFFDWKHFTEKLKLRFQTPSFTTFHKPTSVELGRFNGENPEAWIVQAERYFDFYGIGAAYKLSLASIYLDGEALRWYQWLFRNKQLDDWEHFAEKVRLRFKTRPGSHSSNVHFLAPQVESHFVASNSEGTHHVPSVFDESFHQMFDLNPQRNSLVFDAGISSGDNVLDAMSDRENAVLKPLNLLPLATDSRVESDIEAFVAPTEYAAPTDTQLFNESFQSNNHKVLCDEQSDATLFPIIPTKIELALEDGKSKEVQLFPEMLQSDVYSKPKVSLTASTNACDNDIKTTPTFAEPIFTFHEFQHDHFGLDFPFDPGSRLLPSYLHNAIDTVVAVELFKSLVETVDLFSELRLPIGELSVDFSLATFDCLQNAAQLAIDFEDADICDDGQVTDELIENSIHRLLSRIGDKDSCMAPLNDQEYVLVNGAAIMAPMKTCLVPLDDHELVVPLANVRSIGLVYPLAAIAGFLLGSTYAANDNAKEIAIMVINPPFQSVTLRFPFDLGSSILTTYRGATINCLSCYAFGSLKPDKLTPSTMWIALDAHNLFARVTKKGSWLVARYACKHVGGVNICIALSGTFSFPFDPGSRVHRSHGGSVIVTIPDVEVIKITEESPNSFGTLRLVVGELLDQFSVPTIDCIRDTVVAAIKKTCKLIGARVIFWPMREPLVFPLSCGGDDSSPINPQLDEIPDELCALTDDTSLVFDPGGYSIDLLNFNYAEPSGSNFSLLCVDASAQPLYCVASRVFELAYQFREFSGAKITMVYKDSRNRLFVIPIEENDSATAGHRCTTWQRLIVQVRIRGDIYFSGFPLGYIVDHIILMIHLCHENITVLDSRGSTNQQSLYSLIELGAEKSSKESSGLFLQQSVHHIHKFILILWSEFNSLLGAFLVLNLEDKVLNEGGSIVMNVVEGVLVNGPVYKSRCQHQPKIHLSVYIWDPGLSSNELKRVHIILTKDYAKCEMPLAKSVSHPKFF